MKPYHRIISVAAQLALFTWSVEHVSDAALFALGIITMLTCTITIWLPERPRNDRPTRTSSSSSSVRAVRSPRAVIARNQSDTPDAVTALTLGQPGKGKTTHHQQQTVRIIPNGTCFSLVEDTRELCTRPFGHIGRCGEITFDRLDTQP